MSRIHPTAIIDPKAELADDVEVGAFSIIGADVQIGAATQIAAHVVLAGRTRLGQANQVAPFCSLGGPPQDKKYRGEATGLEIGDRNVIREYCYFNTGTEQDVGVTRLGDDNWIMGYVHVAHDCQIGSNTIIANGVQLAGHVHIGDWAILGGLTGVHQFVQIGAHAMTGAHTYLSQDLPPYITCSGHPAAVHGINSEGLRRRGYSDGALAALRQAYKIIYRNGLSLTEAQQTLARLRDEDANQGAHLEVLLHFLASASRGIVR